MSVWSDQEALAIVTDYFSMLKKELLGEKYSKAEHRRALLKRLNGRSEGAVEFKHQNISAALIELGIPFISGYKPLYNYQRALLTHIGAFLTKNTEYFALFAENATQKPANAGKNDLLPRLEEPPRQVERPPINIAESPAIYVPHGINYLQREAQNQLLGEAGEQLVIRYERARLQACGQNKLAESVEQVSATVGPAAGYDIRSFDENGEERFIETKTTKYGKETPFYVTPNELKFSAMNEARYCLYRVFSFRQSPRLFVLYGNMESRCRLTPSAYSAQPL